MNIFLVGFMGAGKSYIGRKLALVLDRPFADLDVWIETTTGKTIKTIFKEEGEDSFRNLEAIHLRKSKNHKHLVLATGGGTPCFHNNMEWMLSQGRVVFLDPPIGTLLSRLEGERAHRPLLAQNEDATEENSRADLHRPPSLAFAESVSRRLAERRPIYENAHLIVDGDNDEQDILRLIQKSLQ